MWVISFLEHYGLRSRNISLFLLHLRGGNFESLSAGRSEIYSTVYAYVRQRYGLPAGFGVTRFITNGEYYFSHNVFLDFALVFGIWGSMVFLLGTVIAFISLSFVPVQRLLSLLCSFC